MGTIGVFDSGIGGITFLAQARQCLPDESFIYFADSDHLPYGTKSTAEVRYLVARAVDFLCAHGIQILVLACNTATSAACSALRAEYCIPILGMEPAVKPALESAKPRKVLLLSTTLTMREDKLRHLLHDLEADHHVDTAALDELVQAAERFEFDSQKVRRIIAQVLARYNPAEYGAVVLGCTHFVFYKRLLRQMLPPQVDVIDGNEGTLNHLVRTMEARGLRSVKPGGDILFFSSGRPDSPERSLQLMALMRSWCRDQDTAVGMDL